ERAVMEEVDAIGLGPQGHLPRPALARERERVLELVLEQALDERHVVLDLEGEGTLPEPGRRRRTEEKRPFERAIALGQRRKVLFGDRVEERHRVGHVADRDRAVAEALPLGEKALEHRVDEVYAFLR